VSSGKAHLHSDGPGLGLESCDESLLNLADVDVLGEGGQLRMYDRSDLLLALELGAGEHGEQRPLNVGRCLLPLRADGAAVAGNGCRSASSRMIATFAVWFEPANSSSAVAFTSSTSSPRSASIRPSSDSARCSPIPRRRALPPDAPSPRMSCRPE
jgi:hypothetical protein